MTARWRAPAGLHVASARLPDKNPPRPTPSYGWPGWW